MAKDYGFSVEFFGTYGTFSVEANDIDEAYNNATEEIQNALKDLPVQVEFEVECYENPDNDEDDD